MKIRTQLTISMVFFAVALVIISASVISTNQQVDRLSQQEELAKNIELQVGELGYLTNDYLLYRESQQIDRWESKYSSILDDVSNLTVDQPDQQVLVNNIKANGQRLKEIFDDVASNSESSQEVQTGTVNPGVIQVSWSRMAVQSQGMIFDASRLSQLLGEQADQMKKQNNMLIFALIITFAALILANYLLIYQRTLTSISNLQAGTSIIGSGNLDFSLDEKKDDEIGELAHAFNQMTANLKTVTASKADLEREMAERRATEEALRETSDYLENLLDYANAPIIVWDSSFKVTRFNHAFERLTGLKADEVVGKPLDILFPDSSRDESIGLIKNALSGERWEAVEIPILHTNGSVRAVLWNSANIHDRDNTKVVATIAQGLDVTERKKAEEALNKANETLEEKVVERTAELREAYCSLKESKECLVDAQKIAHIGSWNWSIVTNEEYWSDELYHIFGLNPQIELNHNTFLNCIHPEDLEYVDHAINEALTGKPYYVDYRIILPDGEERVIHSQGGVIFDEKNKPIQMRGIVQDITERKKTEEFLAKIEIARKQEIHHRIKNNLQVISSLLDLQAEQFMNRESIKNSEVLEAFGNSQDRVISMALIHEELYKGGGFETLNFSPYIEELAKNLFQTYRVGNSDISLKIDLVENAFFDMDTAVPLGIIVNELVSNSLKYAFAGREKGEIQIKLHREEIGECKSEDCNTTFVLIISDDGVGIPENIDIEDLDSLGLQLVTSLVDQLDGELELKRNNGTEFIIRFAVKER